MPLDLIIAAGKKKPPMGPKMGGSSDIGDLEPLDKRPGGEMDKPEPSAAHEAAESPEYENAEEQGAKLISDIEAAGGEMGMEPEQSRMFAANIFDAIAKCLRGGGKEEAAPEASAPPEMGYGR